MNPVNLCNRCYRNMKIKQNGYELLKLTKGIESFVNCSKMYRSQEVGSPQDCDAQLLDVYNDKPV